MADPRGFLKIKQRDLPPCRAVEHRLVDFDDVQIQLSEASKTQIVTPQSSRCMDCGIPFCHFSCPLGNLIPEFNDLVYHGKYRVAYDRLQATNNFPEFTGRVCPAPCESGCTLGLIDPPVTIEQIEKTISDIAFAREYVKPYPPAMISEKTVAIVGSGPAGLAAAQQLARSGHTVVVYEKNAKPGGLLHYGIPNFKLEKGLITRRLKQLVTEGVRFRTNVEVGGQATSDISWAELKSRFDVVLLTIGTAVPNDLKLQGRELQGIYFAMDYLPNATRKVTGEISADTPIIDAYGKRVLIIGGGDTGSDCLGTALRQGATSVTTLQIMPQPNQERNKVEFYGDQPWPTYPVLDKISTSIQEGIESEKGITLYETTATEFIGDENGCVKAVKLARAEFVDSKFSVIVGSEYVEEFDLVLISTGFRGPDTTSLVAELGVELTERSTIRRSQTFETSVKGVFVAGDAGRGQSLIVWAIAEGRSVASCIDEYLMGKSELPRPISPTDASLRI